MLSAKARKLSFEEEITLARAAQAGDIAARNTLVESNVPLVKHLVRHVYAHRPESFDDIVQEGCFGLMRAVSSFDPARGVRFGTYAVMCIRSRLWTFFQKHNGQAPQTSLDECDGEERSLYETLTDDENPGEKLEGAQLSHEVRTRIEGLSLTAREAELVNLRWLSGNELTLREVGEELGFSRQYAKQVEDRAMLKLRTGLRKLAGEVTP